MCSLATQREKEGGEVRRGESDDDDERNEMGEGQTRGGMEGGGREEGGHKDRRREGEFCQYFLRIDGALKMDECVFVSLCISVIPLSVCMCVCVHCLTFPAAPPPADSMKT